MSRGDLSEAEWRLLKDLLPAERGRKSRPSGDNRPIVNGILWRMRTGIWEAAATVLAQAMADNRHHSIDSTTVRGHVSAAGAKGGLANRLLAARGAGSPVRFIVSVMPSVGRLPSTSLAARRPTARSSKRSVRSPKHGPAT